MDNMLSIFDDKRKISKIFKDTASFWVGEMDGITKIEAYPEPGQMGFVPWFAIYKNDFLWMRIDAAGWGVEYESE